jgi:hypothetical protein
VLHVLLLESSESVSNGVVWSTLALGMCRLAGCLAAPEDMPVLCWGKEQLCVKLGPDWLSGSHCVCSGAFVPAAGATHHSACM